MKHKVYQVERKEIDIYKVGSMSSSNTNIKHASMLAICQLRHPSATGPSHVTHAVDGHVPEFT